MKRVHIRTVVKYTLAQLVDLVLLIVILLLLRRWFDLSGRLMAVLIALWIIKDILLFPILRRSFEGGSPEDRHPMIGARGIARDIINPTGYARVNGELWQVEVLEPEAPIHPGELLRVVDARGLTLLVVADRPEAAVGK